MNIGKPNFGNKLSPLEKQESIKDVWEEILSKFPKKLQEEFKIERPEPDWDDIEMFKSIRLVFPDHISISLEELLEKNENVIFRTPPYIIEEINKNYGRHFDVGLSKMYEVDSDRLRRYSQMPTETASPSVLLDGEIWFGTEDLLLRFCGKTNICEYGI